MRPTFVKTFGEKRFAVEFDRSVFAIKPSVLVVDEAQVARGGGAFTTGLMMLGKDAPVKVLATATPLTNMPIVSTTKIISTVTSC